MVIQIDTTNATMRFRARARNDPGGGHPFASYTQEVLVALYAIDAGRTLD